VGLRFMVWLLGGSASPIKVEGSIGIDRGCVTDVAAVGTKSRLAAIICR
jgi:hypothetical protein